MMFFSRTATDEGDVVLALRAQDLPNLAEQGVDVVADAPLSELPEGREVAADLRRIDVRVIGDLLGGDAVLAHLLRLGQDLQVTTQTSGDTDAESVVRSLRPIRSL